MSIITISISRWRRLNKKDRNRGRVGAKSHARRVVPTLSLFTTSSFLLCAMYTYISIYPTACIHVRVLVPLEIERRVALCRYSVHSLSFALSDTRMLVAFDYITMFTALSHSAATTDSSSKRILLVSYASSISSSTTCILTSATTSYTVWGIPCQLDQSVTLTLSDMLRDFFILLTEKGIPIF